MGWTGHKLPTPGWFLHTRGGTNGVFIQKRDRKGAILSEEIAIPSETIRMLVSDDIRSQKISALEQMQDEEVLQLV